MKIVLLTTIFLMSIHAAFSKHIFYDNLNNCLNDIASNEIASRKILLSTTFPLFKFKFSYENLPKSLIINALICALEKADLINNQGELAKDKAAQYCVFMRPDKVIQCQTISNFCSDLECRGTTCTREELPKYFACGIKHNLLSFLEFALHAVNTLV